MAKVDLPDIPGNSLTVVEETVETRPLEEPKDTQKVEYDGEIKAKKVEKKPKSTIARIGHAIFNEDLPAAMKSLFWDTFIPAAKDALYDLAIESGEYLADAIFYGGSRPNKDRRDRRRRGSNRPGAQKTAYDNPSYLQGKGRRSTPPWESSAVRARPRGLYDFDEVLYDTKRDADEALAAVAELIDRRGVATVANLFEASQVEFSPTDNRYGWTAIGGAYAKQVHGGWVLVMPDIEVIR